MIRLNLMIGNQRPVSLIFVLLLACCQIVSAQAKTSDPLYDLLRNEITYYYQHLSQDSVPVQFMSFGVLDEKTISIDSDMGRASVHETNGRKFCPQISFGTLNDVKGLNRYAYKEDEWMDSQMQMTDLPYENDTVAIKSVIWNALSRMYRGQMAVWRWQKIRTIQRIRNFEKRTRCFSRVCRRYFEKTQTETFCRRNVRLAKRFGGIVQQCANCFGGIADCVSGK